MKQQTHLEEFRLKRVGVGSDELRQIMALGRLHARYLGFFPEGAFESYAEAGHLLGLFTEGGRLAGYTAYRFSRTRARVVIVHLCVSEEFRGHGLARQLVDHLKTIARNTDSVGLYLKCRRDFPVNNFWPKVGLTTRTECAGRGKEGMPLSVWTWDTGTPDLFTSMEGDERIQAVMDANVFYDISGFSQDETADEAKALDEPWVTDVFELCLVDEIYNEINRNTSSAEKRAACREAVRSFKELIHDEHSAEHFIPKLQEILGWETPLNDSRESDLRQLAKSAASEADYFITRDEALLKHGAEILDLTSLNVVRPNELVSDLDRAERERDYSPASVSGTTVSCRALTPNEVEVMADRFCAQGGGEGSRKLRRSLNVFLSKVRTGETTETRIYESESGDPLVLVSLTSAKESYDLRLVRALPGRISTTVLRWVLLKTILLAAKRRTELVRVTDPVLSKEVLDALKDVNFQRTTDGVHVRRCLRRLVERTEGTVAVTDVPNAAIVAGGKHRGMESIYWPLKFIGLSISSYLVPIKAEWAKRLFDEHLAEQELWKVDPILALNRENVYYSCAPLNCEILPGRILWYVSFEKGVAGSGMIRACSILNGVNRISGKEAFRRYHHLGVYQWSDILSKTKGKPDQHMTVLEFSDTELFDEPVPLQFARDLGAGKMIQGPSRLSEDQFATIYRRGFQLP